MRDILRRSLRRLRRGPPQGAGPKTSLAGRGRGCRPAALSRL